MLVCTMSTQSIYHRAASLNVSVLVCLIRRYGVLTQVSDISKIYEYLLINRKINLLWLKDESYDAFTIYFVITELPKWCKSQEVVSVTV